MLSFVIPTLNEEKNIKMLLNSLMPQLEKQDEVIIIDSHSKDRTAEIAEKHGARVILQPKSGIGLAKTFGASQAKNNILVFLDADCRPSPDFAERIKTHFSNNNVSVVGGLDLYEADSGIDSFLYNNYSKAVFHSARLWHRLTGKYWVAANNSAYKKDVFFSVGGFRSVVCEDFDMMNRLPPSKDVVYDPKIVATLSQRRFKEGGFFRTLILWGWSNIVILLKLESDSKDYRKS